MADYFYNNKPVPESQLLRLSKEKGVSLERAPQYPIERLRELKDMHESLREIKNDLNPNMSEYKERKEELLRCLKR